MTARDDYGRRSPPPTLCRSASVPLAVPGSFVRIAVGCVRSASFDTGVHAPFASMTNCPQMLSRPPLGRSG